MKTSVWHEQSELTGKYSVRWYDPITNQKQRYLCDTFGEMQKKKAEIKLQLLNHKKGKGDPNASPLEVFNRYLHKIRKTHRIGTLKIKGESCIPFLTRIIRMENINHDSIEKWQDDMVDQGYSNSTISLRLRDLRAFLNWCIENEIIVEDHFKKIDIPPGDEVGRRLSAEELQALYDGATASFKPFLLIAMETGARRGEILYMDWQDLDLDRKMWSIPAHKCKTKKARSIPLSDKAVKALEARRALQTEGDRVFEGWLVSRVVSGWKVAKRESKITGRVRFHDIRHTFASDWEGYGNTLKNYCGWTSEKMLNRYQHVNMKEMRRDMESSRSKFGVDLGRSLQEVEK